MQLRINNTANNPVTAKKLMDICPFGGFEYNGGRLTLTAACRMCRACVKKGPPGAVTLTESCNEKVNKELWSGVCVYAETNTGGIHPVTYELLGKARELAAVTGQQVMALLLGYGNETLARQLYTRGADIVYYYDYPELQEFLIEPYAAAFGDFIERIRPSSVLVGATTGGRSLAPRVAARFRTGVTADCTRLVMKEDTDLVQIRPAFGGNIMAEILTSSARPQFCTVRYKVFNAAEIQPDEDKELVRMELDRQMLKTGCRIISNERKPAFMDIADAEVIVAAGRGIRNKADLILVEELAEALGAQTACTRPLVENGWFDTRRQIGLSGRTVKPNLLVTCGISGSVQFAAGMSSSGRIVAINNDPKAQIFNIAHYCVIGDLYEILPEFTSMIKETSGDEN